MLCTSDWDPAFLHIWPKEKKAAILDDGNTKWSASTLSRIGEATARILSNPDATANRMIYVQSFCISQNDMIKAYEKASGSEYEVTQHESKHFEKEEKAKADEGDLDAIEELVWLLGTLEANWEGKDDFAMRTLGLENEDLDEVVARIVQKHG